MDSFIPFRVLRLSRAQEVARAKPQSHVYCNELLMTDDLYTFEQSSDSTVVRFQHLLLDVRSSKPMVVPPDSVDIRVMKDGAMTFTLDPDFIDDIMDALDGQQYTAGLADYDTSSSEDDGLDSGALRKHVLKRREDRRIDFSKKVDENLRREARDRRPVQWNIRNFAF